MHTQIISMHTSQELTLRLLKILKLFGAPSILHLSYKNGHYKYVKVRQYT